jgi:hypothetical protein
VKISGSGDSLLCSSANGEAAIISGVMVSIIS